MPAIKEITMENIKGQNTIQELTGKDIIIGSNGIGKTTRLQSLGISLLGYVPGKGKLPAETYKLSSAEKMSVGIKTDDFNFERSFKETTKTDKEGITTTSIKQDISISPSQGEKTIKEKEARILSELGNFPVMMDFNEFLNLSDTKRREFIYELSGFDSTKWTREKVEEYLRNELITDELEINAPDRFETMKEIIEEAMKEYPQKYDIVQGLQSMINWTSEKLSYWKKEKIKAEGAVKKIAELKNQLSETDRNIASNKEELKKLQQELIEIEKQISADIEKKKAIDVRFEKIDQLEKEIEEIRKEEASEKVEDLKRLIDCENKKLAEVNVDYSKDIEECENKIEEFQRKKEEKQNENKKLFEAGTKTKAAITTIQETLKIIEEQVGKCVIDSRICCDKDFSKFVEHNNLKIEKLTTQHNQIKVNYIQTNKEIEKAIEEIKTHQLKRKSLIENNKTAKKRHEDIKQEITALEKRLNTVENFETLKLEKIKSKQNELTKLESEKVDPVAPIEIAEKQKSSLENQIEELELKLKEQEKAKTTLSNLKSSMIDSKVAVNYSESFKYLSEALGAKGIQGQLVKETLEPIKESVQENLKLMGIDKKFYFSTESNNGKEIFQFGWENGEKLNFDALSTGQQLMLLIALMTTIIERANPKVKILAIDNIENLDKKNFNKVIQGLNAISSKLDNIILAGVIDVKEVEGFTVWNLSSEKAGGLDATA